MHQEAWGYYFKGGDSRPPDGRYSDFQTQTIKEMSPFSVAPNDRPLVAPEPTGKLPGVMQPTHREARKRLQMAQGNSQGHVKCSQCKSLEFPSSQLIKNVCWNEARDVVMTEALGGARGQVEQGFIRSAWASREGSCWTQCR